MTDRALPQRRAGEFFDHWTVVFPIEGQISGNQKSVSSSYSASIRRIAVSYRSGWRSYWSSYVFLCDYQQRNAPSCQCVDTHPRRGALLGCGKQRLHHSRELGRTFRLSHLVRYASEYSEAFEEMVSRLRKTKGWKYVDREIDIRPVRS